MAKEKSSSIWTRGFILVFIINTVMQMCQNMMTTLIPRYTNTLGAAASIVGLVGGLFAATALLMRPFAGPAVDYFNKQKSYSIAIIVMILSYLGFAISRSVGMVIAARLLQGCSMGFTGPLGMALASESLPKDKMASGIGVFSIAMSVGQAIGPTVGLTLVDMLDYHGAFFVCAAIMAVGLGLSLLIKSSTPQNRGKFTISPEKVVAKEAAIPTTILFFFSLGWVAISSFIVIYGEARGVVGMGMFFTAYAVVLLLTRPLFGRIADERGIGAVMIPSCIAYAVAFLVMSVANNLVGFIASAVIAAFGYGGAQPALQALCMSAVPDERRGAGANTSYIGIDAGMLVGGYLAGSIADAGIALTGSATGGYSFMYCTMVVPCALALAVYWFNRNKLREIESSKG